MRARRAIVIVLAILVTACSTEDPPTADVVTTSTTTSTTTTTTVPTLKWGPCSTDAGECTVIELPFDHDDPDLGHFDVLLARHRARRPSERIGVLFTNAGGPGAESVWLATDADWMFSAVILDHFDIVAWDPRGTGGSRPRLDCTDDIDAYFSLDPSPDTPEERDAIVDAAQDFVDSCQANVSDLLPYISTTAAARDIDVVRRLLGEETASYVGFSYGSELGATWVTLFPETVRAAVFDAAADPTLDVIDWLSFQSIGFERSLEAFFDECDTSGCHFSAGDARATFDAIMADIEDRPLLVDDDRPLVTEGVAQIGVFTSLYNRATWSSLDLALAEASRGHGDRLLTAYDSYFGGWSGDHADDSIDSYVAITCLDRADDFTVDDAFAAVDRLALTSPRLGAGVLFELLLCALWPIDPSPSPPVRWTGTIPLLVVGSTGDAPTPLAGTRRMREVLGNAGLVVVDSFDHTSYGSDPCATMAIDDYLLDPTLGVIDIEC